jgi:MFS superfamily sulfate permease-like transporter
MPQPLFSQPPTLLEPTANVCAWFFDAQATIVDQVSGPMTLAVARFLTETMEAELQQRYVRAGRKVTYVHDWRACAAYDGGARQALVDWGRASRTHSARVSICMSSEASPFNLIAAATGVSLLRAASMNIELVDSLDEVLRHLPGRT